jgi:hypothetical protein
MQEKGMPKSSFPSEPGRRRAARGPSVRQCHAPWWCRREDPLTFFPSAGVGEEHERDSELEVGEVVGSKGGRDERVTAALVGAEADGGKGRHGLTSLATPTREMRRVTAHRWGGGWRSARRIPGPRELTLDSRGWGQAATDNDAKEAEQPQTAVLSSFGRPQLGPATLIASGAQDGGGEFLRRGAARAWSRGELP